MKSKQWGKNVSWDVKMHCHSVSCSSTREELAVSIRERSMKIVFWKTTACRVCVCVCVWHCRLWEEQQRARSDPQRRLSRNILAVNKEWRYGWRIQRINRSTHWLGAHSKENIKLKVGAAFPVLPTVSPRLIHLRAGTDFVAEMFITLHFEQWNVVKWQRGNGCKCDISSIESHKTGLKGMSEKLDMKTPAGFNGHPMANNNRLL